MNVRLIIRERRKRERHWRKRARNIGEIDSNILESERERGTLDRQRYRDMNDGEREREREGGIHERVRYSDRERVREIVGQTKEFEKERMPLMKTIKCKDV